jgi:hypothetical protein
MVSIGVTDGVGGTVAVAVSVAVRSATGAGKDAVDWAEGVRVGVAGPMRLLRITKAAPTANAKIAITDVITIHSQLDRGGRSSSSSRTMSKSSTSGTPVPSLLRGVQSCAVQCAHRGFGSDYTKKAAQRQRV